jgi:cell division protein FtsX
MVIIGLLGGLIAGGAVFALLKNSRNNSAKSTYTKLDLE